MQERSYQPNYYQTILTSYLPTIIVVSQCPTLRGGWTRFKRFVNILHLITFFCWVVHVTFNSRNTLLKKPWGSAGFTRYSDCASSKDHSDIVCFVKSLDIWGEIKKKRFNAYNFTRFVRYRFSIPKQ